MEQRGGVAPVAPQSPAPPAWSFAPTMPRPPAPHAPEAAGQQHGQQAGEQAQPHDAHLVALPKGPGLVQLLRRMLGQQAQQLPPALGPRGCAVVRRGRAIATRWQGRGQGRPWGKRVAGAVYSAVVSRKAQARKARARSTMTWSGAFTTDEQKL